MNILFKTTITSTSTILLSVDEYRRSSVPSGRESRVVDRLRNWQGRDAAFAAKVMEDMMRECADLKSMKAFVLDGARKWAPSP